MSNKNILIAIIGGAVAGAAAAVLLAPDSGSQTRKKLKRTISDAKDSLDHFLMNAEEQITQWCGHSGNKDTNPDSGK